MGCVFVKSDTKNFGHIIGIIVITAIVLIAAVVTALWR